MILMVLLGVMGVMSAAYAVSLALALRQSPAAPRPEAIALGVVTNFFDALGIGCFAPTTAYLKFRRLVPDELIAPTMMTGYALASATEGFVFIDAIKVDPLLLGLSIGASALGSITGVWVGGRLAVRPIRLTPRPSSMVPGQRTSDLKSMARCTSIQLRPFGISP